MRRAAAVDRGPDRLTPSVDAGRLGAKASGAVSSVKDTVSDAVDTVKTTVDNQKAILNEAVEAGKQAAQDKKQELTAQVEADGDADQKAGGMSGDNASKTSASV